MGLGIFEKDILPFPIELGSNLLLRSYDPYKLPKLFPFLGNTVLIGESSLNLLLRVIYPIDQTALLTFLVIKICTFF
jgi:hypothetical protein